MIRHGVDGFLASTAEEWVEAVATLSSHPELRRKMGQAARISLEQRYSVDSWAPAFVASVAGARPITPLETMSIAGARPKGMATREHRRTGDLHPPSQSFMTSP